ncbi:hypothetical protein GCM10011490_24790 [Pseudoclavibacter endophyticus]|uniref:Pr6Pr family membrane protein n=1 Tax=Pseudoclavibacter endophyticus TaxID=1778590 RepID=A0A6H9WP47_9MICO|nr:Pr6Pr family membrane protein [Pseudoclavibacter endophyticus]KAB1647811.1 hypothetical protein F8O04_12380 [Pseudoclavibacter endophyticus]GGA73028.1 hypothetical protein GCM10011490_24790 [Pseudoclavibacter endophyticus]
MSEPRLTPPVTRNRRFNLAMHPDRAWVRVLRIAVAAFAGAALVKNTIDAATGAGETDLVQHFSLFTIQSNLMLVAVLGVGAVSVRRRLPAWWDDVRGAVAFYLVMTGLIYAILVAPPGELFTWDIGWTGIALHRVAPVFAVLDWALVSMTRRSGWGRPLAWLLFPVAYLLYTWARGGSAAWYPYGFLDPLGPGGWAQVLATTAQVFVAFLAVSVVMHAIGRLRVALARGGSSRSRGRDRADPVEAEPAGR